MIVLVDPEKYFRDNQIDESLVLRLRYSAAQRKVDLIFVYAADTVSMRLSNIRSLNKSRDFRRLVFCDVHGFSHASYARRDGSMATIWSHEQVDDYCLDTSIRHIAAARPLLDRSATGFQIDLVLHSVSAYRFHFTHLLSDRRLGQLAKASLTESRYIDQESGEIFMFDEPFPEAVPDDVA